MSTTTPVKKSNLRKQHSADFINSEDLITKNAKKPKQVIIKNDVTCFNKNSKNKEPEKKPEKKPSVRRNVHRKFTQACPVILNKIVNKPAEERRSVSIKKLHELFKYKIMQTIETIEKNEKLENSNEYTVIEMIPEFTEESNNIKFENKTGIKNNKISLYEKEKKRKIQKEKNLEKKFIENEKLKEKNITFSPQLNQKSEEIMRHKKHCPLYQIAGELHRKHLYQISVNEKNILQSNLKEENKKTYSQLIKDKTFNWERWDNFFQAQIQWNYDRKYKAKAAELDKNIKELLYNNFQPQIDKRSRNIMNKIRRDSSVEESCNRLFNDYEIMQEKKKIQICNSLPNFKPRINKINTNKLFRSQDLNLKNSFKPKSLVDFFNKDNELYKSYPDVFRNFEKLIRKSKKIDIK